MDEKEKNDMSAIDGEVEENQTESNEKSTGKSSVKDVLNNMKNDGSLIKALGLIIMGLLFCICRSSLLNVLFTIVGVVLILLGAYDIYRKNYTMSAIELIVGIIVIALGWTVVNVALLIIGILMIAYAIYRIYKSIDQIKLAKGINKVLVILNPIALLIFGILLITSFWVFADALFIVIGVIAIIEGIMMIVQAIKQNN